MCDSEDFNKLTNKISSQIRNLHAKIIIIYGHCAGAAFATYLATNLIKDNRIYLLIGGASPILSPDDELKNYLRHLMKVGKNISKKLEHLKTLMILK